MKTKFVFALSLWLFACAALAQEQFSGIGVVLGVRDGTVKIMDVIPDSPASKAGLTRGLLVQKIDGTQTDGSHLKDWVDKLRGEAGTKVKLELVDTASNKTNTVELTREQLKIKQPQNPPLR